MTMTPEESLEARRNILIALEKEGKNIPVQGKLAPLPPLQCGGCGKMYSQRYPRNVCRVWQHCNDCCGCEDY